MRSKIFLYFFSMLFIAACEDNSKTVLLFDAMESKGLADSITGKERTVLLDELEEIRKEILSLGEDETSKGKISEPMVLYTEKYNACLTIEIADDYLLAYTLGGDPTPEIFYKEMWVFRCKSDKDTITYDPKTISETNPPKCRDGKTLDGKKYKQSIEAVRLQTLHKENEEDPYSAYDKLAERIMAIRDHAFYKNIYVVKIFLSSADSIVYDEINIDKIIKVAKLARDAGFYRYNTYIYKNDDFNNYENILKKYRIIKNISGMQYYPTINLGEPWNLKTKKIYLF